MTYIEHINTLLRIQVGKLPLVIYGQNITRGSCLGGFTRGVLPGKGGRAINTTNAESTLAGLGFGMLLEGQSSIFFTKQMDFLLLGIDQLVNTYNNIRSASDQKELGSYTIFPITVDSGLQGPQSSLNTFADFCTIAKIRGYTLTNKWDAGRILSRHLTAPGFRLMTVSQRMFKDELLPLPKPLWVGKDDTAFQYYAGDGATVVAFNFALPQAFTLREELKKAGIAAALFNVNSPTTYDCGKIIESTNKTKKLIVLDDSKSDNLPHNHLLADDKLKPLTLRLVIKRELKKDWLYPVKDLLEIDYKKVVEKVCKT